jgi:hypothetical protein
MVSFKLAGIKGLEPSYCLILPRSCVHGGSQAHRTFCVPQISRRDVRLATVPLSGNITQRLIWFEGSITAVLPDFPSRLSAPILEREIILRKNTSHLHQRLPAQGLDTLSWF